MPFGEVQQPARLLQGLPGLHGDAGVEAGAAELRLEVGGQEVAAERRHRVVDPAVLRGVVPPEVLVGVDAARAHGPITTATAPGPCTPRVSVSSMSAVRLGPVMNVQFAAAADPVLPLAEELAHAEEEVPPADDGHVQRGKQRDGARPAGAGQHHDRSRLRDGRFAGGETDLRRRLLVARTRSRASLPRRAAPTS